MIVRILLAISLYFGLVQSLIKVPVAQRSYILPYQTSLQYWHAYFDINFNECSSLVQADNNATYFFSRTCNILDSQRLFISIEKSQHISICLNQSSHQEYDNSNTLSIFQKSLSLQVNSTIILDGYQVVGMCQYGGSLDYVVGLELNSNELRVIRFAYDSLTQLSTVRDYKVVDRNINQAVLQGNIYVDCACQQTFKSVNTYTIGIAGTYFHPNSISSYYLAKFSTLYNFTEYFVISEDNTVMEQPRGIKVDLENEKIYIAVAINKNKYNNRTVYQPGTLSGVDNANVAIVGYSWTYAVRLWTTVLGHSLYPDSFAAMESYGNNLYVYLNSQSTQYSTNSSQTDIFYYRLRPTNGNIEIQKIFGSAKDDKVLDLKINFRGIFVLAIINDQLLPHLYNDKTWATQGGTSNLVVILMDFLDSILDIEGDQFANIPSPYPTKIFVPRTSGQNQTMVYIAPRTNSITDNGGIFITYSNETYKLFSQIYFCPDTCTRCSPQFVSKCLQCKPGYVLWKHQCYQTSCPTFSYPVYNETLAFTSYCKDCHYTCRTCSGPKKEQCATCCTNNICGPINNRSPNMGICECPAGLTDSNGICVQRCTLNLAGKRQDMCYPVCPANSYPEIKYDQAQAQERSQYDSSSQTDCLSSGYHLKFKTTGKGLPLPGPQDFLAMPNEFTISFWVRPIQFNPQSYMINAFDRVQVKVLAATNKVYFTFKTGSATTIDPVYPLSPNDYKQQLILNQWNSISISLRQYKSGIIMYYEQQMAIANNNMAIVMNAGYDNTKLVQMYTYFTNTIYVGALNDLMPNSFNGYIKELKIFSKYHGFAQMQDELLRMYRYYSYDDPQLVSYWKFTEPYGSSDIQYTLNDYSKNMKSLTYSLISETDYPTFTIDSTIGLNLCIFHDVALCRSLDYSQANPYVTTGKRLTQLPSFKIPDLSYVKQDGDQLWFVYNNTQCTIGNILAYMTYKAGLINNFIIENSSLSPINLQEATHYQVCYFRYSENVVFNLYQVYIFGMPKTVDPQNRDAYMTDGVIRKWLSSGGDQAYGDFIKFSEDCSFPLSDDYTMQRSTNPDYGTHATKNFPRGGNYFFCWQPVYVQQQSFPYFEPIFGLRYKLVTEPSVSATAIASANMNEDMTRFDLLGTFSEGDQITFAWPGYSLADCNPLYFLGQVYQYNYSYWPSVWFGQTTGVNGIILPAMDEIHVCYKSVAGDAPNSWVRLKKTTGMPYFIRINEYTVTSNQKCPELTTINPLYGAPTLYETDSVIQFNFKTQQVFPSRASDVGPVYGKIRIYRGAIKKDGTIFKTSDILWKNDQLDDLRVPDPLQQTDLMCTGSGQCSILLSQQINKMKAGEIYYLSFYLNSFAAKQGTTRYYLFNDKLLNPGLTTAYDHLFSCRSFDIIPSSQMINGVTFSIIGIDLVSKIIKAQEQSGTIVSALFTTKSITLVLTVLNTLDTYCIANPPVATVAMADVTQTSFTVRNLELRQCNIGSLSADIELVRGIQDQYGEFTYVRSEKLKNIQMGIIGCDASCLWCSGTTATNCIICADPTYYLYMGKCYPTCPSFVPYFNQYEIVFQRQKYNPAICMTSCEFGTYADGETKECLDCNPDCQQCASNLIASCLSCNPIKYLLNGICLSNCPSPHHQNNFTDYTCTQISSSNYLSVKIQSLGYKSRIPKEAQAYLKVSINNDNGGKIISILWEQLDPLPISDNIIIFSTNSEGDYDNKKASIKLKMTAFNFMYSDQVIKVKCTVTNEIGDISYDIYEFYTNESPQQGNTTVGVLQGTGNGTALSSIYNITLDGWFDRSTISVVKYKVYLKVDTDYFMISDQFTDLTQLFITIPPFSSSLSVKNISLCISAQDYYDAYSSYCYLMLFVKNNLTIIQNYTAVAQYLLPLNYANNITNVLLASQTLYFAMNSPRRTVSDPGICTLDTHCNFHGKCISKEGTQKCMCNQGYQGSYCQFQGSQLQKLRTVVKNIISALNATLSNRFEIKTYDIDLLGNVLRGILKDPDLVTDDSIDTLLNLVKMIGNAQFYVHFPASSDIVGVYLAGLGSLMGKIFQSYQQNRAFSNSNSLVSGQGMSGGSKKSDPIISDSGSSLSQVIDLKFQAWGRTIDEQINQYIDRQLPKLNPDNPIYMQRAASFELAIGGNFAAMYKGIQVFIRQEDSFWTLPETIFDNVQGKASNEHMVYMKAVKWSANPFAFELDPGGYTETNVTTMSFYDANQDIIHVTLSLSDSIEIRQPWNKTQSYNSELLGCMYWDDVNRTFVNDNSCAFSLIWDIIPCPTCDQGKEINTTVALCRCSHLSRFAVAYEQTNPMQGVGVQIGLYSDFFAMQYWRESFGYFATMAGIGFFIMGHIVCYIMDRRTQAKVYEELREKVRAYELRGFKQKIIKNHKKKNPLDWNIQFFKKTNNGPKVLDESGKIEEHKEEKENDKIERKVSQKDLVIDIAKVEELKKPGKKKLSKQPLSSKKTYAKDESQLDSDRSVIPLKGKKGLMKSKNKNNPDDMLDSARFSNDGDKDKVKQQDKINNADFVYLGEDKEMLQVEMKRKYLEEVKLREWRKLHPNASSSDEHTDISKAAKNKVQKRFVKLLKKREEFYWYKPKAMIIHGNYVASILYVTSILSPRHVRWTLCFCCIVLTWFWCAVIFMNTKDPLQLPDFNRKARNIATEDLWVSVISPFGTMILMYIFAGLFKISDSRIKQSFTSVYLENMLIELKKEMKLRFLLAYFITVSIFSAIFWYIIKFTAQFGWVTSWSWWYNGIFALGIQFLIYDPMIALVHWIVYYCSRQLAIFIMKLRMLKQANRES